MDKKIEIGQKLKDFGENNFLSMADFSRKLGMKNPQQLYDYFKGKSFIGSEYLIRLHELGCDINWLLKSSGETLGSIAREPIGATYMTYSSLLEEKEALTKKMNELKIKVFDLLEENQELKNHIAQMQVDYDELVKEITKLKVAKEEPNKILRMEKAQQS